MNQLPDILHTLKSIAPRTEFSKASKMLILNTPKRQIPKRSEGIFQVFFRLASSNSAISAGFLLVFCLSGILYAQSQSPRLAARQSLHNIENEESAIQIKLSELAAYEESAYKTQLVQRTEVRKETLSEDEILPEAHEFLEQPPLNPDIDRALELML